MQLVAVVAVWILTVGVSAAQQNPAPKLTVSPLPDKLTTKDFKEVDADYPHKGFSYLMVHNDFPTTVYVHVCDDKENCFFTGSLGPNTGTCSLLVQLTVPAARYTISATGEPELLEKGVFSKVNVEFFSTKGYFVNIESASQGDDIIQSAIDRIAHKAHQELQETSTSSGQNTGWSIENATGYDLHLYLSGPIKYDYVVPSGKAASIDLPPGTYRIAVEMSAGTALPFYAVRQLSAGTRWKSHFYIAHQ